MLGDVLLEKLHMETQSRDLQCVMKGDSEGNVEGGSSSASLAERAATPNLNLLASNLYSSACDRRYLSTCENTS